VILKIRIVDFTGNQGELIGRWLRNLREKRKRIE